MQSVVPPEPPISDEGQVALLRLLVELLGESEASSRFLRFNSHFMADDFRLQFEGPGSGDAMDVAVRWTNLDEICVVSDFDARLSLLVNSALREVEVWARKRWVSYMTRAYGPHGYARVDIYRSGFVPGKFLAAPGRANSVAEPGDAALIGEEPSRIKHLPVWVAAKLVSFGVLAKHIGNLAKRRDRLGIVGSFDLDEKYVCPFLQIAARTRNVCAHHGCLWNSKFVLNFRLSRLARSRYGATPEPGLCSLHNTLVTTDLVLSRIAPGFNLCGQVASLLQEYPDFDPKEMGFPDGWRDTPGWRVALEGTGKAS